MKQSVLVHETECTTYETVRYPFGNDKSSHLLDDNKR